MKVRCADPPFCCGQEWDAPDPVPCPKCGSVEHVGYWDAWGHPNGELMCYECLGYNSPDDFDRPYWTWTMVDGKPEIHEWERSR